MVQDRSDRFITKGILKLAHQINAASAPVFLPVEPGEGCLPAQGPENAAEIVRQQGGAVQHGWRMREQPAAFVEAHFHSVWRREDGTLIDVTPRLDGAPRTLFLPDSKVKWTGDVVEPQRLMLNMQPCYCGSGMPFKICHGVADD